MLKDFIEGKRQIIVPTSALGIGINIADIKDIVHVNQPRTLLDYVQESSQAGQDKVRSEANIIGKEGEGSRCNKEQMEKKRSLVEKYMGGKYSGEIYRRVVLDRYLDRKPG